MQEVDAERRIQILRGEKPSTPPPAPPPPEDEVKDQSRGDGRVRKRRRIAGEDDTDRDIRLAREDGLEVESGKRKSDLAISKESNDAPVVDARGHINLFPAPASQKEEAGAARRRKPAEKNAEAEAESARKKREFEDQYTMRFSNAAGFKKSLENPWYSSSNREVAAVPEDTPGKDVWGNEDPRRKEREKMRAVANDPLAMMKKGVKQLREVEKERKNWEEERARDLRELKEVEEKETRRRHRRRRRRRSSDSEGSLEGFSLDAPPADDEKRSSRRKRSSSQQHHRRRSRERSRERNSRHSHRRKRDHSRHRDGHDKPSTRDDKETWRVSASSKRYSAQFATG